MADDVTFTVDGDGATAELTLPGDLVDALAEGEQDRAEVVADVAQMAFTSRAHMLVHHSEEEVEASVADAEERARELFEERFGVSYAEATGHSH
jgi:predicted aspartyl protease